MVSIRRLIRRLLLSMITFVCVAPVIGQVAKTPDLSGTWKFNPALSAYAKNNTAMAKAIAESIVIISSGESIEFHQSLGTGDNVTRTYRIDGKEHLADVRHADPVVIRGYSTAMWKGSTLVVEFRSHLDDPAHPNLVAPEAHVSEKWNLSSDGRVLTEKFETSYGYKMTLVYEKQ